MPQRKYHSFCISFCSPFFKLNFWNQHLLQSDVSLNLLPNFPLPSTCRRLESRKKYQVTWMDWLWGSNRDVSRQPREALHTDISYIDSLTHFQLSQLSIFFLKSVCPELVPQIPQKLVDFTRKLLKRPAFPGPDSRILRFPTNRCCTSKVKDILEAWKRNQDTTWSSRSEQMDG